MVNLKERLRNREFVAGTHIGLIDSSVTELYGNIGFDFVWIDTEHSAIDYEALLHHIIAAKAGNINSLVRIPWNDAVLAKRVLEMGPDGIIFPMVNTHEELEAAMQCTLYPPLGNRGFGPMRAVQFGNQDLNEYIHTRSLELARCVQLETKMAIANLREMVKNPYVDCFIIGPCDLSGSIGELNEVFGKFTIELIQQAVKITIQEGKSIGVSTLSEDPVVIEKWNDLGFNFISAGGDATSILTGAQRVHSILRSLRPSSQELKGIGSGRDK